MNWARISLTAQLTGRPVALGPYPRGAGEAYALAHWGRQAAAAGLVLSRDASSTTLYAEIPS
jgi:hypothetical protein